jgi:hypothetical protein
MLVQLILLSILGITQPISKDIKILNRFEGKVYYIHQFEKKENLVSERQLRLSPVLENFDTLFNDDGIPSGWLSVDLNWWAQKFTPGVACTLKKVLIMSYTYLSNIKEIGNLYIWRDASGVPGELIAGPIEFQGDTYPPVWREIELPDIVISDDFWVGFYTPYPPYLWTDRRFDYPRRVASSMDGNNWSIEEDLPWGDFMLRVVGVLTGERHDVALWRILQSPGPLLPIEGDVMISAVVQNFGNVVEDSCPISYTVSTLSGTPVISDTLTVPLLVRQNDTITFARRWHTTFTDEYRISAENLLASDVVPENDSKRIKSFVHVYPSTLRYDDGSFELLQTLGVDSVGRLAMKFTPPYYPCKIESLKLYLLDGQPAIGLILDDDGRNGEPSRILGSGEITASQEGWYSIDFSAQNIVIGSGSFYAAYQNPPGEDPSLVGDLDEPLTGLDWTYFDTFWVPDEGVSDWSLRVCVNFPAGISEADQVKKSSFKIITNPIKTHTSFIIPLNGKTILTIYNLSGQICKSWVFEGTGMTKVSWNLRDEKGKALPTGVYFVTLTSKSDNIREKIVLFK